PPPPRLHPFPTRRSSDLDHLRLGTVGDGWRGGEGRAVLRGRRDPRPSRWALLAARRARARDGLRADPLGQGRGAGGADLTVVDRDRKSTRLNSSHVKISY